MRLILIGLHLEHLWLDAQKVALDSGNRIKQRFTAHTWSDHSETLLGSMLLDRDIHGALAALAGDNRPQRGLIVLALLIKILSRRLKELLLQVDRQLSELNRLGLR